MGKRSIILGTGAYTPPLIKKNSDFEHQLFYSEKNVPMHTSPAEILEKFRQITGINERRYTTDDLNASDIGFLAAKEALADSGIDPESIDQLIVAHNFGDVLKNTIQTDAVPSLACRIKHALQISNPGCVAYDILFGCPGWIQGVIQADAFFKAGVARRALVIGTETLSRVIDSHDRDSMIFSDGAGAAVLEYRDVPDDGPGILSYGAQTHSMTEMNYIRMGSSYFPESDPRVRFIKMKGRKVYEYAMTHVPLAMKNCLDASGVSIGEVKKIFIHQANEKMDEGIIARFYALYGIKALPSDIMPMSIHWLGNSSVATVPTLLDMVRKKMVPPHELHEGDIIILASVGAGMSINAICYRYGR